MKDANYWGCDFTDSDGFGEWCTIRQFDDDKADWDLTDQQSPTKFTGPPQEADRRTLRTIYSHYKYLLEESNTSLIIHMTVPSSTIFASDLYVQAITTESYKCISFSL